MPKKILVVDDNIDTADIMRRVLQMEGYEVDVAYEGEQGLVKVKEYHPDLILLDLMMPVMDGYTMNQHLKKDALACKIPVIVVSARSGMAPVFEGEGGASIQGYLVKPVSPKELLLTRILH